jgi:hypothetical protein
MLITKEDVMKKHLGLILASAIIVAFFGCKPPLPPVDDFVTGVTITGTGVTGTGASKEITVTEGTPVDLDVTITKSGDPDVTENWVSADDTTVGVVQATGVVSGLKASATGVIVTVTVGGKHDSILVRVTAQVHGLILEFDTDKLEFYSLATTAATPTPATVVKNGNVITLSNVDGTFKEADTLQGSSYLLLQTPMTGDFEVKAAVRITLATGASDRFAFGVGMFVPDGTAKVFLDSQVAVMAKRCKTTPDMRSMWSKSNSATADIGAGSPYITPVVLGDYHILSLKRIGSTVTFEVNGMTADVVIDPDTTPADGMPDTTLGMWPTLAGSVKVGVMFAGVTAEVEGFIVNTLNPDGSVLAQLYKSSDMPAVDIEVNSINVTGPVGNVESARLDMNGLGSTTLQLSTAITPSIANVGTTIGYTVQDAAGDTNVSVDPAGLVTITGLGDCSATIVATSGNGKTDTYVITLYDSSLAVTDITIPSTLDISASQSLTLSPVTVSPAAVSDKSVTWSSDSTAILVDASTGVITVAGGTAVGTTGKVKATSVLTPAVSSNECTVTVIIPAGTPQVFTFPNANWWAGANQAVFLASATVPAEGSTTNFNALASATLNSLDGLSYKSNSAGQLRLRYSATNGNAVNYNGSSMTSNATLLPANGASVGTDASLTRYISVPLNSVGTPNVTIDVVIHTVLNATLGSTTCKVGLVGSDYLLISTLIVDTTTTNDYTFTWTGAKGTLSSVIFVFSREGSTGGGIDVRSITVTPQL